MFHQSSCHLISKTKKSRPVYLNADLLQKKIESLKTDEKVLLEHHF